MGAIRSVAAKIGRTDETLRKWVRQAERDRGSAQADDRGERTDQGAGARGYASCARRTRSCQGVSVFCPGGAHRRFQP